MNGRTERDDDTPDRAPRRRPALMLACYVIAAVAIGLDQWTKTLAVNGLDPAEPVRLFGGMVYLSLTRNPGAAFSIATDYTWILAIVASAVVVFLAFLARKIVYPAWAIALGLVLGGAAGNLIDRIFREPGIGLGHVVDFISVLQPHGRAFPIFNVADSSLVCGVILIVLLELTGHGFSPAARRAAGKEDEQ
ncbi:signal peptidase II [Glycomyces sp. L485]|uniref:signal peptidase II n=1 Tax=Glycomyces sp. L485 TaxID=2909235 RepID=UPI001F4BA075|nr:signal peptidase II [Glycomyces sp. L485]MCH7231900.1 signal peptidase II [Glycomyces sp. L485]